jgi:glycerol-1-phosphate dehydrogenase [NAD(P)+]
MMNGIAMEVCGSSRPASGSEHLISHALDQHSNRPRLHGLQVGVATYWMSLLQQENSDSISQLFTATGFWDAIAKDRFSMRELLAAIQLAPSIKPGRFTVLSLPDSSARAVELLRSNALLQRCYVE